MPHTAIAPKAMASLHDRPRIDVFDDVSVPCGVLAGKDAVIARALDAIGRPVIRRRIGGFEGLFRIIVEQQVSVASAQAIWARCCDGLDALSPDEVLSIGEDGLKSFGLSGPKARYVHGLAAGAAARAIDFSELPGLTDEDAAERLMALKGIGPWTAGIYLLFCEGRVDIWPARDVALLGAYRAARKRGPLPDMAKFDEMSVRWAPYRGLAAHIFWTYYAHIKGRTPI